MSNKCELSKLKKTNIEFVFPFYSFLLKFSDEFIAGILRYKVTIFDKCNRVTDFRFVYMLHSMRNRIRFKAIKIRSGDGTT